MPRSRGSEMPQQRQSPRTPLNRKPTEANSIRSPKLESRSPRSPLNERKKGSRVADLESKLGHAQEELEKLKEQLASAEAARIAALKELEETKKKNCPASPIKTESLDPVDEEKEKTINMEEEKVDPVSVLIAKDEFLPAEEDSVNCSTTDVFEVASESTEEEESTETKLVIEEENRKEEMSTVEKENEEEEVVESQEIANLRAILAEKEKQVVSFLAKNQAFTKEAEQMETKLAKAEEELNNTKMIAEQLKEKLELEEDSKTSMQAEMKRLRVQTEQWRKAAEAAASVLVAGDSGRSMEKHLRGCDVSMGGGGWSPVIAGGELAEGNGGGKRRFSGGGIRAFGELWKKKGQMK